LSSKTDLLILCSATLAEWAIARLQVEARHSKEAMSQKQADCFPSSATGELSPLQITEEERDPGAAIDIGKYHGTSQNHHGDLYVTSRDIRYVTAVRSNVLWRLQYDEIKTIQKTTSGDGLVFAHMDATERRVMGLKTRNEIFTQIVGYSDLIWQVTG